MSRGGRKSAQQCKIPFWLSAELDCKEKRFSQVGDSLLTSDAFKALPLQARLTYLCCAMESGGRREFEFSKKTMEKYGLVRSSTQNSLQTLIDAGFIAIEQRGKCTRTKTIYRFSPVWKGGIDLA